MLDSFKKLEQDIFCFYHTYFNDHMCLDLNFIFMSKELFRTDSNGNINTNTSIITVNTRER